MKRILAAALITGLVAVPSFAAAQHGADDTNQVNNVRQEDRQQDKNQQVEDKSTTNANEQQVAVPNQTTPATVENNATLPAGSISVATAISTAQTTFPTKTVVKVELENEEGTIVYSVRFSDGSRVDVRASDGTVARTQDGTTAANDTNQNQNNNANDDNDHENSNRGSGSAHSGGHDDNSGSGHSGRGHAEDN